MKTVLIALTSVVLVTTLALSGCHDINCLPDSHFTAEGELMEKEDSSFVEQEPSKVKLFMEASGSMTGLYRSGCQSEFRDDIYQIASYYLNDNDLVYVLCQDNGRSGYEMTLPQFATAIKLEGFQSMNATSITDMMETVINNIDASKGEVAVLVSDMKFDPTGNDDIAYQLGMYTTKVSHITSESKLAFSLIAATSKYYSASNEIVAEESPYYYLVIGNTENVCKVRNDISTMLLKNGTYVENIETGMQYCGAKYSIEPYRNCLKLDEQNALVGRDESDPCSFKIKLELGNYRWALAGKEALESSIKYRCLHGSTVSLDSISIDSSYVSSEKRLKRDVVATLSFTVANTMTDCDVFEWIFNPCCVDTKAGDFQSFFGASSWKEFDKTYSIENFTKGLFRAANLNTCSQKPHYILISKHD